MYLVNCTICFFFIPSWFVFSVRSNDSSVNLEQSFLHFHDNVVSFVIQVVFAPPVISAKMYIGIVSTC